MTIFEKNYKALKNRTFLLDKINECLEKENLSFESNRLDNIDQIETKEAFNAMIVEKGGRGYRLNSSYYPTEEARIWASQFVSNDTFVYITLFGLGNGIFARELMNRLRKNDVLYIYEPCAEIFLYTLHHYDISDLLAQDNIFLAIEEINEYEFHTVMRDSIDWLNVHYQMLCCHPYYDELFPYSYKDFLTELKNNNNKAITNRNTYAFFGEMSVVNMIHNLKYLKNSFVDMDFIDDFAKTNVPAIIVSAGPSLNKNIDLLKEAKGKAVIFCVDRALDHVLNQGIEPDFVVTIDSSKPVEYFSKREDVTVPLFCTPDASIPVMQAHKGKKIMFAVKDFVSYLYFELNKKTSPLNTGGCVATGAFSICVGLGFKTIILIGQDLAFSPDKSTHAGGIQGDSERYKKVFTMVEGIDGNPVETRYDWFSYLRWFEDSIKMFPELNVIDATEGGAKIKGSRIMTLREAIAQHCVNRIDCKAIIEGKKPTFNREELKRIYELLNTAAENLEDIKNGADQAKKHCEMLIKEAKKGTVGSKSSQKLVEKISEINTGVMKYPVYHFVDNDICNSAIKNLSHIYKLTGDEKQDQINTYQKAYDLYDAMEKSAEKIKPWLAEILPDFENIE